ncbi:Putative PTS system EIIABC component [Cronobacter sakazakii]|nr:Putative PTS system EIIABC component [Cronobacter sakazakii]
MQLIKTYLRLNSRFNGFLTFYVYPVVGTLATAA